MLKPLIKAVFICSVSVSAVQSATVEDWRKTGSDQQKLQNVIAVIPGASNLMIEMGERYKNLYWAGKQGKWQFAEYQVEEMEALLKTLMITRPKRAATAQQFLDSGFGKLKSAFERKDSTAFFTAFEYMRGRCMTCHGQNDHAFIVLPEVPARGSSPVLDVN